MGAAILVAVSDRRQDPLQFDSGTRIDLILLFEMVAIHKTVYFAPLRTRSGEC